MPGLLSIGRFAHACRLSIKALRHYDEVGLLAPARVDGSGYRFYARGQIKTAISISLLRSLDVPIPAIRAILAAKNGAVAEKLDVERRRIERDLARSRRALSYVERMMREGEVLPYAIAIRDQPAATLLSLRSVTAPELHVEAGFALFEQLAAALREAKLPVGEPVLSSCPSPSRKTRWCWRCARTHRKASGQTTPLARGCASFASRPRGSLSRRTSARMKRSASRNTRWKRGCTSKVTRQRVLHGKFIWMIPVRSRWRHGAPSS